MSDLRSSLIRLAHANPELRPHVLPLLKEASPIKLTIGRMSWTAEQLQEFLGQDGQVLPMYRSADNLPKWLRFNRMGKPLRNWKAVSEAIQKMIEAPGVTNLQVKMP